MSPTIECQKRPENSKARALRREGLIPANLYGHDGANSVHLVVKQKEAEMLLRKVAVNKTIVDVNIPDLSWQGTTFIRELQVHPWKGSIYHISFFAVDKPAS